MMEESVFQRRLRVLENQLKQHNDDDERVAEIAIRTEATSSWNYLASGAMTTWRLKSLDAKPTWSFSSQFEESVSHYPNRTWVIFEDAQYTYKMVNEKANQIAHWLHSIGIKRGDVVGLMMENRPEFIWTWLGACKIGAITAFVNFRLHGSSLAHVLKTADAKVFIVGSELIKSYYGVYDHPNTYVYRGPHGNIQSEPETDGLDTQKSEKIRSAINLDEQLEKQLGESGGRRTLTNPPEHWLEGTTTKSTIWYIYTSGTTGLPKAAKVVQRNLYTRTNILSSLMNLTEDDVIYCCLPLFHSSGSTITLTSIFVGAAILLRRNFSAREFWNDCRKYNATVIIYIGELCRYLVSQPEKEDDLNNKVRLAIGNGLRADIWEKFKKRFGIKDIIEFYSSTEGTSLINLWNKTGAVGYTPWLARMIMPSNNKIVRYDIEKDDYVRDSNGFCIECKANEVGELLSKHESDASKTVGTGGTFAGYTDPKATEKKIMRDVLQKGDAWFKTGDLFKTDSEGFYYFVDRIGDTFRWKGENVSTNEVAEVVASFDGIEEANVYGVEVSGYEGRCGMASIVMNESTSADNVNWNEFYNHLKKNLPIYAQPVFIRVQSEIEKTSTFKLRKVELVKEGFDPTKISDRLFFRDDKRKTFVPLSKELYQQICNQGVPL